jgi:hypothetical protein
VIGDLPGTTESNALPRYRLPTGPDDASFCNGVSEVLETGYELAA